MAARIPPSLAWLIDKRSRLGAELQKAREAVDRAKHLIHELEALELDLAALDRTLAMHEIVIDKDLIEPRLSQPRRIGLKHGELTHALLAIIREHDGEPVPMMLLIEEVAKRHPHLWGRLEAKHQLRESVRYRLKGLAQKKVLQRHPPLEGSTDRRWSICDESFVDDLA
ncbi:hypothetical protein ACUHMQ_16155 [Chitinimonas sp. PSY-7]|uniref:hypothetical protein n=1 Tax=Chitinimonas sp. PSY-7 TaxID=3459088 RepID=UPI00403FDE02